MSNQENERLAEQIQEAKDDAIYAFCRGHYYIDEKIDDLWEPFENYKKEEIDKFIADDVSALKGFLKHYETL